jgi:hypothetical protein
VPTARTISTEHAMSGCRQVASSALVCAVLPSRDLEISKTSNSRGIFVIGRSWVRVPPPAPVFSADARRSFPRVTISRESRSARPSAPLPSARRRVP